MPSSLSASDSSSGSVTQWNAVCRGRAAAPPSRAPVPRAARSAGRPPQAGRRARAARGSAGAPPAARRARRRRRRPSQAQPAAAACVRSAPCRRRPVVPSRRDASRERLSRQASVRHPRDLDQADEFVDAGDRQAEQRVDVVAIEPGAVLEDLAERPAVFRQPAREGARPVELGGVERAGAAAPRRRGGRKSARRAHRRASARDRSTRRAPGCRRRRFAKRARRRARRLADAALAAEEDESGNETVRWQPVKRELKFDSSRSIF